ncbi:MAG: DnaJ domain-containing protein [Chloroflexi bacterium]|nr:DnaJ domain-containing protein [Chloroflexota bacterium]MBU1747731.1 DnaJ domain-containing protein [Chloroflexota bacterium]MBU1879049.1 DnaJ domain-containing protein [Chloroflexota bacterium]
MTEPDATWIDYYRTLGVSEHADADEIKRAYRRMARRHHPDIDHSPDAAERFLLIQTAFDVLGDSERRVGYDIEWQLYRQRRDQVQGEHIAIRWALSQQTLPYQSEPQVVYALLDLVAGPAEDSAGLPLNLCLLLDCSSSMRGPTLMRLKEAAHLVIDQLDEQDSFSLVAFHDRAQVLIPNRGAVHPGVARAAINNLGTRGGTEIAQGLAAALEQVKQCASNKYLNQVVFLTDGYTYGDDERCRDLARQAGAAGINISALGLGPHWNEDLLDDVATLSGGTSLYIDSPEGIVEAFQDQMARLRDVFVQNAQLQVALADHVTVRTAYRFFPAIAPLPVSEGTSLTWPLGRIERHTGQTLLIEFQVAPPAAPGPLPLAQLQLDGRASTRIGHLIQADLVANCELDPEKSPLDVRLRGFLERVVAYRLQERAWQDWAAAKVEEATSRLRFAATKLLELGEVDLARETIREAKRLEATGQPSSSGKKRIVYGTRSLTSGLPWRRPRGRESGS